MLIKKTLIIFILILFVHCSFAQENNALPFWKQLEYGGNLGLAFGSKEGSIDITPSLGLEVVKNLHIGIRLGYNYYYNKTGLNKYSSHSFTTGFYSRYIVFSNFYVQGEYNFYRTFVYSDAYIGRQTFNVNSLMAGVGYRQPISTKSFAYFSILWDFLINENSVNTNPVIQAGVGFNF